MQSASKTTCSDKTSPTDRATVIVGSDRTGGQQAHQPRYDDSYTGPATLVTVSPRSTGAPTLATKGTPRRAGAKPQSELEPGMSVLHCTACAWWSVPSRGCRRSSRADAVSPNGAAPSSNPRSSFGSAEVSARTFIGFACHAYGRTFPAPSVRCLSTSRSEAGNGVDARVPDPLASSGP